jgi:2-polyprenyl-3-methyl-5-hydroxy-6-metoxy-1,4-benzoquinol methylase
MKGQKHKYQIEYENSKACFWQPEPAKYVKLFVKENQDIIPECRVLDLGAGEGKNAVYMASFGADVLAIDISPIALSRFTFQPNYDISKSRIKTVNQNVLDIEFEENSFDIVIAYGILHCLDSTTEILKMISKIKRWTKLKGFFIGATFTDEMPIPKIQEYLSDEALLKKGEMQQQFSDWKILFTEDDIITETHPTSKLQHNHSITRIITQKI